MRVELRWMSLLLLLICSWQHHAQAMRQPLPPQVLQPADNSPLHGLVGRWEGSCFHYGYLNSLQEDWSCSEVPVTYPVYWDITRNGSHCLICSSSDEATINHNGKAYHQAAVKFDNVAASFRYKDDYGMCVHLDVGGGLWGEIRLRTHHIDGVHMLVEEALWRLKPESGQLVGCPKKSKYMPLSCDATKNILGYRCIYYKV